MEAFLEIPELQEGEKLGMGPMIFAGSPKEGFVQVRRPNAEIMLEQIGVGRNLITGELDFPLGRGINIVIEVADVEEVYKVAQNRGDKIFLPKEEKRYVHGEVIDAKKQFCVQDPDGYLLRIFERIK